MQIFQCEVQDGKVKIFINRIVWCDCQAWKETVCNKQESFLVL